MGMKGSIVKVKATNSDSDSTKSNGARVVSPSIPNIPISIR